MSSYNAIFHLLVFVYSQTLLNLIILICAYHRLTTRGTEVKTATTGLQRNFVIGAALCSSYSRGLHKY